MQARLRCKHANKASGLLDEDPIVDANRCKRQGLVEKILRGGGRV
jgi:hypothetical protein